MSWADGTVSHSRKRVRMVAVICVLCGWELCCRLGIEFVANRVVAVEKTACTVSKLPSKVSVVWPGGDGTIRHSRRGSRDAALRGWVKFLFSVPIHCHIGLAVRNLPPSPLGYVTGLILMTRLKSPIDDPKREVTANNV